jgi:hypothetical protein
MADKGMIPGAPPTAPGGMSRKALIAELVDKHGYEAEGWEEVSWPTLIDTVIAERLEREAEAEAEHAAAFVEPDLTVTGVTTSEVVEEPVDDWPAEEPLDDLDDLLTEFEDEAVVETPVAFQTPTDQTYDMGATASTDEADRANAEMASVLDKMIEAEESGVLDPEALFAEMVQARAEHDASQPAPIFLGIPGVKDFIFDNHAGAGPSGAERWMNCTMSLSASRAFLETLTPRQQQQFAGGSTAARQGTTAHAAAEVEALRVIGQADDATVDATLMELMLNPDAEDEAYDEEMGEWITEYVDLVRQYAQERGDDFVMVENRVEAVIPLAEMHEGEVYVIRGSADLAVMPTKKEPVLAVDLFDVVMDAEFENGPGSLPDATLLDSARLATLMTQAKGLVDLYSDLRAEAQRRLHRGEEVPGYWLVNHSPKRHWKDGAAEVLESVAEVWTEPALMSPAAAEKALGKDKITLVEDFIVKPDKVPLISTGEKDRRKRWEGKPPEQMFADESTTGEDA